MPHRAGLPLGRDRAATRNGLAEMHRGWGSAVALDHDAPSCAGDAEVQQSWARTMQQSASKHNMPR